MEPHLRRRDMHPLRCRGRSPIEGANVWFCHSLPDLCHVALSADDRCSGWTRRQDGRTEDSWQSLRSPAHLAQPLSRIPEFGEAKAWQTERRLSATQPDRCKEALSV